MKSLLTIAIVCGLFNLAFSQNFGIDVPTPLEKLHINGSIRGNIAGALRISTGTGYVDVGPQNSSWAHFQTDRASFYFNPKVTVDGNVEPYTDNSRSLGTSGLRWTNGYFTNLTLGGVTLSSWPTGGDNLGNHTATTTLNMNGNVINNFSRLEPSGIGGNSGQGDNAYAIFQEGGAWSHPYPDLRIAYHTGIKLGANSSYNGIRFYNDYNMATQTFSIGDGDNDARFHYNLRAGGNTVIDAGGGWHRSYGQTGWYNGTYGGGWWMTDGSWVRTYNPQPITFGLGASANAAQFGGVINSNSTSDGHQINPLTGNWGYVGTSGQYWYYMYSQNFVDPSQRKLKRNITPLDDNLMAYVMRDIEKIKPTFYKYKTESDEMVKGFEAKYRPNMHLGVILDEAPDYLQDNAFSGIDLYSLGAFALTGVKYLQQQISNTTTVGRTTMTSNTVTVQLPAGFYNSWEIPFINITPTSPNSGFYISNSNATSFTVSANSPMSFNWQAVRSNKESNDKPVPAIDVKLANQLAVDQSKKAKIHEYWSKEKERSLADYNAYLEGLKAGDPVQYERLMEENKLAENFGATSGKSGGYDVQAMRKKSEAEAKRRNVEMSKVNKTNPPDPTKIPVAAPIKK